MVYRAILVESSKPMLETLSNTLKKSESFELLSTCNNFNAALWFSGFLIEEVIIFGLPRDSG